MTRLILNRHPDLCVPAETWFFPKLMRRAELYGDLSTDDGIDGLVRDILASNAEAARPVGEVFGVGAAELGAAFRPSRVDSFAAAYGAFLSLLARREGKALWGEKTPFHTAILPVLARAFPAARFVAMVRDPRDVVGSIHRGGWRFYPTLIDAAMRWRYGMEGVERALPLLGPERFFALRYEDLVRRPAETVQVLCAFLDLDDPGDLLEFRRDVPREVPRAAMAWHGSLTRPIDPTYVGRFRDTFDRREIGLIEAVCGRSFERWGYRREGRVSPLIARGRLALWSYRRWRRQRTGRRHWSRMVRPMDL